MNIPVGDHQFTYQGKTVFQFFFGPARNEAADPAGAGRIGNNAVFSFYSVLMAPLPEFPDKTIGYFARKLSPILFILVGKCFCELWDPIVSHIDKACGIIYYKAYGDLVVRIKNLNLKRQSG